MQVTLLNILNATCRPENAKIARACKIERGACIPTSVKVIAKCSLAINGSTSVTGTLVVLQLVRKSQMANVVRQNAETYARIANTGSVILPPRNVSCVTILTRTASRLWSIAPSSSNTKAARQQFLKASTGCSR